MSPPPTATIAGLHTTIVGPDNAPLTLVLLHGYAMRPADLSPFAHSIGVPARFLLPQGPIDTPNSANAWWPIDEEARDAAIAAGPRDLFDVHPPGLANARQRLENLLDTLGPQNRLVVGGFSQGGMLALDWMLHSTRRPDALVLLSASCLNWPDWQARRARLSALPVFVSHGRTDPDLAFSAGERLRDYVLESAARVSWIPFDGGHEIPLVVWRGLRKFLSSLLQ